MKQAKAEAASDIEAYRTEQENDFQLKSASVRAHDPLIVVA